MFLPQAFLCTEAAKSPQQLWQVIDSRPRVALPAAESSATCGREQHEQRPRVDNFSLSHEGHRLGGGGNLSKTQRLTAANARREGRPECPIPPVAKRCYPRPFPPSPPRSLSPSFSAIHHLQPTKRKINFKKMISYCPKSITNCNFASNEFNLALSHPAFLPTSEISRQTAHTEPGGHLAAPDL